MSAFEYRRQKQIKRDKLEALTVYPRLWRDLVSTWGSDRPGDTAWLMYSANYLLRTAGVRWAIDPVRLEHRLPGAPSVDYTGGLSALSFVVLTHRHSDHLDIPLIRSLAHLPIAWVVPAQIRKPAHADLFSP